MIHRIKLLKSAKEDVDKARAVNVDCYTIGLGGGPRIPISVFLENRKRLLQKLSNVDRMIVVFIDGGNVPNKHSIELLEPFVQESLFYWMFGVLEPGFCGAIDVLDEQSYLFCPRINENSEYYDTEKLKEKYLVDFVKTEEVTLDIMSKFKRRKFICPCNEETTNNSRRYGLLFNAGFLLDVEKLNQISLQLIVTKVKLEIGLMRHVTSTTANGIRYVMSCLSSGMRQFKANTLFSMYVSMIGSCHSECHNNYCVITSDIDQIVHFAHGNSKCRNGIIVDGDLCILNMCCSYFGHYAMLSATFPICGEFSEDQRLLYEVVLNIRDGILNNLGRGMTLHRLNKIAGTLLLKQLKYNFDLLNHSIEDLMESRVQDIFMPLQCCSLVSLSPVTLAVSDANSICLDVGMILEVGTGCFFIDYLIDRALKTPNLRKFIRDDISRFSEVGGVLLKDLVLITNEGYEVLSDIPRSVEDVEGFLADVKYNLPRKSTRRL